MPATPPTTGLSHVAVLGMAGRFPGARHLAEFWRNLRDGVESIHRFTEEELQGAGVAPALWHDPAWVKAFPRLPDVEMFDAGFFGFSPRDAAIMDPQHRHFLECAWEALENAGCDPATYPGAIGVFAGCGQGVYYTRHLLPDRGLMDSVGAFLVRHTGNDKDFLCTRVSYEFDLKGPSVSVQTACSTSLVAIHQACQSLLSGECEVALAGGVTVMLPQDCGYPFKEGEVASPDGHCRAFDAHAQGTVFGNGVGVVVLKPLANALRDGDVIRAVIRGSAVNNDGSAKAGYLAPSVDGQAAAVAEALAVAGVDAGSISFVEAHGTGTAVGDPIEVAALTQAFRQSTGRKGFCALGSIKTNIGHTDAAAGVAGFIKTVLALEHRQIPATLHFERPNPEIDFANSPFFVSGQAAEWRSDGAPRRAGVNSVGIGGTNAHVILEEAPPAEPSGPSRPWQLLVLSARTAAALDRRTQELAAHCRATPDEPLADVAFTLQTGRKRFEHRRMAVCRDRADTASALETVDPARVVSGADESTERPVAFLFTGQGAQYVNMGRELYLGEPTFRASVDACAELLRPHLGLDLRAILYPEAEQAAAAAERIHQTAITQPALFVVEYALAQLWREWGVEPEAMLGHSIGEYVAACLAGVFPLEAALALVAARGRLMQEQPGGAMLAVPLPEADLLPLLSAEVSLAAVNGPSLCVLAGTFPAIAAVEARLAGREIAARRLHTSHAFHSAMMEPMLARFAEEVRRADPKPPQRPFLSNVTGTWITDAEAADPAYWVRHARQTVRFAEGLQHLLETPHVLLLEAGPGHTLSRLTAQHPGKAPAQPVLASLPHANERTPEHAFLLNSLGRAWLAGVKVDWPGFYAHERRRRVPLPTYPWEHQRYWIEPQPAADATAARTESPARRSDVADWFHLPDWRRSLPLLADGAAPGKPACWLVFEDECGLGERFRRHLEEARADATATAREPVNLEITAVGDLNNLALRPMKRRELAEDEVELEVRAAGLNFRDVLSALGLYPDGPVPLGSECAGRITRLGRAVHGFAVGDEVVAVGSVSFGTYFTTRAQFVAPKPARLSFEEAATVPVAFLTARYGLECAGRLRRGERVLIHAASGGVGLAAVQLARRLGAEVFVTAGRPEKREFLASLGLEHVFDSRSAAFVEGVRQATRGKGVDVILNSLPGNFLAQNLSLLAPCGRFVELSKDAIYQNEGLALHAFRHNLAYLAVDLEIVRREQPGWFHELFAGVMAELARGELQPLPFTEFGIQEASQAFQLMMETKHIGKIVLSLRPREQEVVCVRAGDRFRKLSHRLYRINPASAEDCDQLVKALAAAGTVPDRIVHGWNVTADTGEPAPSTPPETVASFDNLFHLAQAIARAGWTHPLCLAVLSNRMQQVGAEPVIQPGKALLLGPTRVIPREMPNVRCASIDLEAPAAGGWREAKLLDQLQGELEAKLPDPVVCFRNGERWVQVFEPVRFEKLPRPPAPAEADLPVEGARAPVPVAVDNGARSEPADPAASAGPATLPPVLSLQTETGRASAGPRGSRTQTPVLREGGVYVITGGLGGLGLVTAEYLAKTPRVKLVLVGRTGLPRRDDWAKILASTDPGFGVHRAIKEVQALEAAGATVMLAAADVTRREELEPVLDQARERFGAIHGVIHAAGVVEDNLLPLKTVEEARRVLAPKVGGTVVLEALLGDARLDFFLLFSSVSALLGAPGQVDYTAANAFLDAFARWKTAKDGTWILAVNWAPWKEVGMAAHVSARRRAAPRNEPPGEAIHPWLRRAAGTSGNEGEQTFVGELSPERDWVLSEYRLRGGNALIAGAAYLELARAAFQAGQAEGPMELHDVMFIAPLEVAAGEERRIRLRLTPGQDGKEFVLESRVGEQWHEHARGGVRRSVSAVPGPRAVAAIRERCSVSEKVFTDAGPELRQEQHLEFGPRWKTLRRIHFGTGEALATLELAEAFAADLERVKLHPALLDLATAFALPLLADYAASDLAYVPISCKRAVIHRPLPRHIFSHARCLDPAGRDVAAFDVTLMDADGGVLVEVEEFTLKGIRPRPPVSSAPAAAARNGDHGHADPLGLDLAQAISPAEGMEALARIFDRPGPMQVVVSPQPVTGLLERMAAASHAAGSSTSGALSTAEPKSGAPAPTVGPHPRPSLATPWLGPRNELETAFVGIWEAALGLTGIGVNDNFFELGGHSLSLTQTVTRMRKAAGVDIPLAALFARPTVADVAAEIEKVRAAGPLEHLPRLKAVPREAFQVSAAPAAAAAAAASATDPAGRGEAPVQSATIAPEPTGGTTHANHQ